jgi:hypothetical protein
MNWHAEALPKGCLDGAQKLRSFSWLTEFYLAGGTALALHYGHRVSVDLDFFSPTNDLGLAGRDPILEGLESIRAGIEEQKDGTIHARLGKTHISFFRYRYPLLRPPTVWKGIRIAGTTDIGLMKVGAIIGRGSKKDFVDLYTILKKSMPLSKLLRLSPRKFGAGQDFLLQAYRAMVYFADADREPMPRLLAAISWDEVKRFFESEVRKLARPFR